MNDTRRIVFGATELIDLKQAIQIPETIDGRIYKCRVMYNESGIEKIDFSLYQPRLITSLQLVENNEIDYTFKGVDRSALDRMMANKTADDILIVKNGYITDTSFSNIVFFDGEKWITPSTYLLNGIQRQYLLAHNLIQEKEIRPADLKLFQYAKPINAMLDLDNNLSIINNFHW
jgi:4-amino-4-deoxychorismate lyase